VTLTAVFYLLAAFTVAAGLGVVFTTNVVHSALALMGTLLGVAAMFVLLGADFLGVVQLLVYVGGILVLTLFAVMLTSRVDVRVSNRAVGRLPAAAVALVVFVAMTRAITTATWVAGAPGAPKPTVYGIGSAFLGSYVLPFEIASLVLLVALIGAVVVSRKEVKG
jgi:NADH:ubiquinone oxidoreductase subunit 6 (subunit J)